MSRKFIFYFKNSDRGIVITDNDDSKKIETIKEDLKKTLSGNFVSTIETKNDILVFKSSDVFAIHIVRENNKESKKEIYSENDTDKIQEPISAADIIKNIKPEINIDGLDDDTEEDELDVEQTLNEIDDVIENEMNSEGDENNGEDNASDNNDSDIDSSNLD